MAGGHLCLLTAANVNVVRLNTNQGDVVYLYMQVWSICQQFSHYPNLPVHAELHGDQCPLGHVRSVGDPVVGLLCSGKQSSFCVFSLLSGWHKT